MEVQLKIKPTKIKILLWHILWRDLVIQLVTLLVFERISWLISSNWCFQKKKMGSNFEMVQTSERGCINTFHVHFLSLYCHNNGFLFCDVIFMVLLWYCHRSGVCTLCRYCCCVLVCWSWYWCNFFMQVLSLHWCIFFVESLLLCWCNFFVHVLPWYWCISSVTICPLPYCLADWPQIDAALPPL